MNINKNTNFTKIRRSQRRCRDLSCQYMTIKFVLNPKICNKNYDQKYCYQNVSKTKLKL